MSFPVGKYALAALAGLVLWIAPLAEAGIVDDVRVQAGQSNFTAAEGQLRDYKAQHGVTPEYVEALSCRRDEAVESGS
jgi:hypothetical protein